MSGSAYKSASFCSAPSSTPLSSLARARVYGATNSAYSSKVISAEPPALPAFAAAFSSGWSGRSP